MNFDGNNDNTNQQNQIRNSAAHHILGLNPTNSLYSGQTSHQKANQSHQQVAQQHMHYQDYNKQQTTHTFSKNIPDDISSVNINKQSYKDQQRFYEIDKKIDHLYSIIQRISDQNGYIKEIMQVNNERQAQINQNFVNISQNFSNIRSYMENSTKQLYDYINNISMSTSRSIQNLSEVVSGYPQSLNKLTQDISSLIQQSNLDYDQQLSFTQRDLDQTKEDLVRFYDETAQTLHHIRRFVTSSIGIIANALSKREFNDLNNKNFVKKSNELSDAIEKLNSDEQKFDQINRRLNDIEKKGASIPDSIIRRLEAVERLLERPIHKVNLSKDVLSDKTNVNEELEMTSKRDCDDTDIAGRVSMMEKRLFELSEDTKSLSQSLSISTSCFDNEDIRIKIDSLEGIMLNYENQLHNYQISSNQRFLSLETRVAHIMSGETVPEDFKDLYTNEHVVKKLTKLEEIISAKAELSETGQNEVSTPSIQKPYQDLENKIIDICRRLNEIESKSLNTENKDIDTSTGSVSDARGKSGEFSTTYTEDKLDIICNRLDDLESKFSHEFDRLTKVENSLTTASHDPTNLHEDELKMNESVHKEIIAIKDQLKKFDVDLSNTNLNIDKTKKDLNISLSDLASELDSRIKGIESKNEVIEGNALSKDSYTESINNLVNKMNNLEMSIRNESEKFKEESDENEKFKALVSTEINDLFSKYSRVEVSHNQVVDKLNNIVGKIDLRYQDYEKRNTEKFRKLSDIVSSDYRYIRERLTKLEDFVKNYKSNGDSNSSHTGILAKPETKYRSSSQAQRSPALQYVNLAPEKKPKNKPKVSFDMDYGTVYKIIRIEKVASMAAEGVRRLMYERLDISAMAEKLTEMEASFNKLSRIEDIISATEERFHRFKEEISRRLKALDRLELESTYEIDVGKEDYKGPSVSFSKAQRFSSGTLRDIRMQIGEEHDTGYKSEEKNKNESLGYASRTHSHSSPEGGKATSPKTPRDKTNLRGRAPRNN